MNIVLGLWTFPTFITLCAFLAAAVFVWKFVQDDARSEGFGNIFVFVTVIFVLALATIISLAAWLIYFVALLIAERV